MAIYQENVGNVAIHVYNTCIHVYKHYRSDSILKSSSKFKPVADLVDCLPSFEFRFYIKSSDFIGIVLMIKLRVLDQSSICRDWVGYPNWSRQTLVEDEYFSFYNVA